MGDYWGRDEEETLIERPTLEMTSMGGGPTGGGQSSSSMGYSGSALEPWWKSFLDTSPRGIRRTVTRLYYSRMTALIYIVTFVAAALLLATTLGASTPLSGAPHLVKMLESAVSISLAFEVVLRAYVIGRAYLQTWSNIFDAVIAVASVSLLFVGAPADHGESKREDIELSQSLVMLRIMVQFMRVLFIAEHAQRMRKTLNGTEIGSPLDAIDLDFGALKENSRKRGPLDGL